MKHISYSFILFVIFCTHLVVVTPSVSQKLTKVDSLIKILDSTPQLNGTESDTLRMVTCLKIGDLFEKDNPDSAIWWYSSVIDTNLNSLKIKFCPRRSFFNAVCLKYIGYEETERRNFKTAVVYLRYSLEVFKVLEMKDRILNALISLGHALSDGVSAIPLYEQALKLSEELGDKKSMSVILNNLGVIEANWGNFQEGMDFYRRSLKIKTELEDKFGISNCYINMGNIAYDQGNYSESYDYYNSAMKIKKDMGDNYGVAACLINLGNIEMNKCNYPGAINNLEVALKISEELNDQNLISQCLNNLGIISKSQGNYSDANSYYERSLAIAEKFEDFNVMQNCLMNLGTIEMYKGNYNNSRLFYERSLKINTELLSKMGISQCLSNLAIIELHLNNLEKATELVNRSLKIHEELDDKTGASNCYYLLGNIASTRGKYADAVEFFEQSLRIAEESGNGENIIENSQSLAMAYIKEGTPQKAITLLLKAKDMVFKLLYENFSILSETEKELFLDHLKGVFNNLNKLNFSDYNIDDSLAGTCYNNELILKGLLLKSSRIMLDAVYNSKDQEVKNAFLYLKQYREKISKLQGEVIENKEKIIAEIEELANEQERKLVKMSAEFEGLKELFSYKWEDVQKSLGPGEAAIEFVQYRDQDSISVYSALLITRDTKYPESVRLFDTDELKRVLNAENETGYIYISSLYGDKSNALYELIWKPLEPALKGIKKVYYSPVGLLNKISFAGLPVDKGSFLCDKYILYLISSTGLLVNKEPDRKSINFSSILFGGIYYSDGIENVDSISQEGWNYLPGTLNEVNNVGEQFRKKNIAFGIYTGNDADERIIKEIYAKDSLEPGILHISTHGFFYPEPEGNLNAEEVSRENSGVVFRGRNGFGVWMYVNNKNPMMRSGLVFAGANRVWHEDWGRTDNEGVLTAYEVSNLNMKNTDLVVLSACETGLGDIKGSEGVYGLQRAFKMAGVKYVIMSLWQVPDKETVEFMETFYKKLLKTKDVRLSFNETQKEMRKKYDPYYWASFVLIE